MGIAKALQKFAGMAATMQILLKKA
ncbi:hypothetical protein C5167_014283 [Papaver somniferum]|uniref:Uncharacterized protein n=1 Tax=Papaver somniferum TaxID=3469 RepID=A0A4Y7J2R8_PAPSO|nr:hypothetical protein C5167_014283 [Papaver somniferum]